MSHEAYFSLFLSKSQNPSLSARGWRWPEYYRCLSPNTLATFSAHSKSEISKSNNFILTASKLQSQKGRCNGFKRDIRFLNYQKYLGILKIFIWYEKYMSNMAGHQSRMVLGWICKNLYKFASPLPPTLKERGAGLRGRHTSGLTIPHPHN